MYEVFEKTIASLTRAQDVKDFIADLLTATEKTMLAKRLAIAILLEKGYDYRKICQILKVSFGTINAVIKQKMIYGQGYKIAATQILRDEELAKVFLDITKTVAKMISHPAKWQRVESYYTQKKLEKEEKEI